MLLRLNIYSAHMSLTEAAVAAVKSCTAASVLLYCRDMKPSNVFLTDGKAVIGDFGLGRHLSGRSLARTQVGTPLYFSPEVCQEQPYGLPSDVWAFGCASDPSQRCQCKHVHSSLSKACMVQATATTSCTICAQLFQSCQLESNGNRTF